jgi:hypothetical protein
MRDLQRDVLDACDGSAGTRRDLRGDPDADDRRRISLCRPSRRRGRGAHCRRVHARPLFDELVRIYAAMYEGVDSPRLETAWHRLEDLAIEGVVVDPAGAIAWVQIGS